jgi:hypothetical protein
MIIVRGPAKYLWALAFLLAFGPAADGLGQTEPQSEAQPAAAAPPADAAPSPEPARDLIPSLIEMGVDILPLGIEATDGANVLAAVNTLRRHDGLPRFDRLGSDAAAYVAKKIDVFRAQRARIVRMQYALSALGFDPGPIDGYLGPRTALAVQKYQQAYGLPITGELSDHEIEFLDQLRVTRAVNAVLWAPAPQGSMPLDSSPLTKTEIGNIRQQIEACWQPPEEARNSPELIVKLHVSFNEDGTVESAEILNLDALKDALARAVANSALRAVFDPHCSPYKMADKPYAVWKDVKLALSPSLID